MENKQSFDEQWEIIRRMVNTSRQNMEDDSPYFLIWGWAVLLTALLHYVLIITQTPYNFLPWPVVMTLTAVFFIFYTRKKEHKKRAKTYVDSFLGKMWTAIAITLVACIIVLGAMGSFRMAYIVVIMLFSMGAAVTGAVISFRPLVIGGVLAWLSSLLLTVIDFPDALLVLAFAITSSYLVPAYMLKNKAAGLKAKIITEQNGQV